ncbi:hypothetical protein C0J52_15366 [Blattella germanica]|nr:hypothetical protein C0J52_15366 [Blattella germanica]
MHLNYPPPHSHQHQGLSPPVTRSPGQGPPELPPRIDRTNKPARGTGGTFSRSAAERLFGKGDGDGIDSSLDPPNYINATPHHRPPGQTSSSLERHNMKTSSYDSVSSYDSYNNRLGPNAHDDLKCGTSNGTGGAPLSPRNHDPYRFTRSTAQPINNKNEKPNKPPDYNKYRPGDYKPMPPPKTGAPYKPVPPPKPKNYRPPLAPDGTSSGGNGSWGYGGGPHSQPLGDTDPTVAAILKQQTSYQHAKSYSVAGGLDAAGCLPQHNGGK